MKIRTLFPLLALLVPVLKAETLVVLSGNSIQEKIDAASDGDIIAIFGGTYDQNIIVNKKVRLVELAGQDVYITGSVTFTGLESTPLFQGFRVGSINVRGSEGLVIKDVYSDSDIILWGNGTPDVSIVGGSHGSILQRAGTLVTNTTTIRDSFNVQEGAVKTIAFRSTVLGVCNWAGTNSKGWFGYGSARRFSFGGDQCNFIVIGSIVDVKGSRNDRSSGFVIRSERSKCVITNSAVFGVYQESNPNSDGSECVVFADAPESEVILRNNYFSMTTQYYDQGRFTILLQSLSKGVVSNNFLYIARSENSGSSQLLGGTFVTAPFGITVSNNHLATFAQSSRGYSPTSGGAKSSFMTVKHGVTSSGDLLVNNEPLKPVVSEFLTDLGDPDPRYNDLDGSRNDIGPSGGAWYDPEGWTTENPVVISFDLSPDQVVGGVNDEVEISEIQAISAP
ncbi:hypothetical protein OAG03_01670 [Akkermansiaceae bacterium]|nr:hypothetical protein [Akkermansiaceae bacterium]